MLSSIILSTQNLSTPHDSVCTIDLDFQNSDKQGQYHTGNSCLWKLPSDQKVHQTRGSSQKNTPWLIQSFYFLLSFPCLLNDSGPLKVLDLIPRELINAAVRRKVICHLHTTTLLWTQQHAKKPFYFNFHEGNQHPHWTTNPKLALPNVPLDTSRSEALTSVISLFQHFEPPAFRTQIKKVIFTFKRDFFCQAFHKDSSAQIQHTRTYIELHPLHKLNANWMTYHRHWCWKWGFYVEFMWHLGCVCGVLWVYMLMLFGLASHCFYIAKAHLKPLVFKVLYK